MAIDAASTTTAVAATPAVPAATPTSDQQSAFEQAMANAQIGATTSDATSATASGDPLHLALFSILQNAVVNLMAEVDANRKDDSDDPA